MVGTNLCIGEDFSGKSFLIEVAFNMETDKRKLRMFYAKYKHLFFTSNHLYTFVNRSI